MEKRHRDLLISKHVYLVTNLDLVATHLLDYLYTDGLLLMTDLQEIEVGIELFQFTAASVCFECLFCPTSDFPIHQRNPCVVMLR